MIDGQPDPAPSPESYTLEIVGKLRRREAEALALDLKELARRHDLKVAKVKTQPLGREDSD
jgi:hypothetical protein